MMLGDLDGLSILITGASTGVSAALHDDKHRPYTSRPRSGEREGPIAKQWEGEGRPCYLFLRRAAQPDCRDFHEPLCTKGPGAPHPPNADASGPSLSPLSRGEVYRRSPNLPAKMCESDGGLRRDDGFVSGASHYRCG